MMTLRFRRTLLGSIIALLLMIVLSPLNPAKAATTIIYVDANATGGIDNGSNWDDARLSLQDALGDAAGLSPTALNSVEIWVAAGTYKPTTGTTRTETFQLINHVSIYGGFTGGESTLSERDPTTNITVLSGDIGVVDATGDNSYHVVTGSGTDTTAILDGFTITAGNASDTAPHERGAGMYNDNGSPTVTAITFLENSANVLGGGMYNTNASNPFVSDVIFHGNSAGNFGGGMYNDNSSPIIINAIFVGNVVSREGGGLRNFDSSNPVVTNVTFAYNAANNGAGVANRDLSNTIIQNAIFWGNRASISGNDMYSRDASKTTLSYSLVDSGEIINLDTSSIADDGGNITDGRNPLFVATPTPGDGDWTTPDDNDYGNLQLQRCSPAVNAGNNTADLDGLAGGDTIENILVDLASNPRVDDEKIIDMGAYERIGGVLCGDPTGLGAAYNNGHIDLTWTDDVDGEETYTVERSTDGGSNWTVLDDTLADDSTTYADTAVVCDTTYTYRVSAVDVGGSTDYSNTASDFTLPCAPTGLTATFDGTATIDLTWTDNVATEDGYTVERSTDGGSNWTVLDDTLPADSNSYADTSVACDATYSYRVTATNPKGSSTPSNMMSDFTLPCAPTELSATFDGTDTIDLAWMDNAATEDGYTVERSTDGGSNWTVLDDTLPADSSSYADTSVVCDTTYSYRITATNPKGSSTPSNTTVASTAICTTNGDPTDVSAFYLAVPHTVDLNWTDTATNEDNYTIERKKDGAADWYILDTLAANIESYTDDTVTCDQDYIYRVTATNAGGSGTPVESNVVNTECDIFNDVPSDQQPPLFEPWIEDFYQAGITEGCNTTGTLFCPTIEVNRGQMAVFILRALAYPDTYTPTGTDPNPFTDVPSPNLPPVFELWIEDFLSLGITTGCNADGTLFCPEIAVDRGQMAVFILRALDITPVDDPSNPFVDVPSPNQPPAFEASIETFYNLGITTGCNGGIEGETLAYCPEVTVDRGQMALFILRAFDSIEDPNDP